MRFSLPLLSASALLAASGVSALSKVSRVGRYLYDESGTRFFVKGIAYQEPGTVTTTNGFPEPDDFIDPLVDSTACNRDLPYLKQLGVNAVRVYSVDPTLNHDACMQAFSGAGIYTIIDLSQPKNGSLDRSAPKWTTNLLNLYLTTIDAFSKYDNVLAFTVGNEVVTAPAETVAAPFIKAAARDVKAYLKSKSISALVTYASTDGSQWRNNLAQYLSCGDESTTIDLYGLNNYEWKGDASIQSYGGTNTAFSTYNIPAYFSEYGSNANFPTPRPFTEVAALFGPEMSQTWSGGLAFSYFQGTEQGFGVVDLSEDGSTVTPNQDFTNLQTQYGAVTFQTTPAMADAGATQYPACVEPDGVNFLGSNTLPPTPNQDACNCVVEKASPCVYQARTENFSAVVGPLFSFACSTLGSQGSDACSDLAANGTTGVYGPMSACDPQSQLSFVFGAFYEASGQNVASCNFDGNATLNANAPTSSSGVEAATSSCLSNALSVSTPTGPSSPVETTHSGGSNGTTTGGGSGDGTGAATRVGMAVGTMFLAFLAGVAML